MHAFVKRAERHSSYYPGPWHARGLTRHRAEGKVRERNSQRRARGVAQLLHSWPAQALACKARRQLRHSCPRCSPACDAVPPCAGLCAMSVLRPCHSRTRRPARSTHHALLEAHASTSRPCTARRRLVEAPALSDRYPSLSIKIALIAPRAPARNLLTPRGGLETAFQEK